MIPLASGIQGCELGDRYRLDELRGETAPLQLWNAVDETLGRTVAVVVVSGPTVEETIDTARKLSVLSDHRLASVLDVGRHTHDGTEYAYVVYEDLTGYSLSDWVAAGPLSAEVARSVIGEIAQGLAKADQAGLRHGHLTADHIIQTEAADLRVLGTAVEAAAYGTSEAESKKMAATDATALIRLLYLALTAERPNPKDLTAPNKLVQAIPADLNSLCVATLTGADDAPKSAADVVEALMPWGRIPTSVWETGILRSTGRSLADNAPSVADPDTEGGAGGAASSGGPGTSDSGKSGKKGNRKTSGGTGGAGAGGNSSGGAVSSTDRVEGDSFHDADVPVAAAAATAAGACTAEHTARGSLPVATGTIDPKTVPSASQELAVPEIRSTEMVPHMVTSPIFADVSLDAFGHHSWQGKAPQFFVGTDARPGFTESALVPPPEQRPPFEEVVGTHQFAVKPRSSRSSANGVQVLRVVGIGLLVILAVAVAGLLLDNRVNSIPVADDAPAEPTVPVVTPTATDVETPNADQAPAEPTETADANQPVTIGTAQSFDPEGDGDENDDQVERAFDNSEASFWATNTYKSAKFGNLKDGVGMLISIPAGNEISQVTLTERGSGGTIEIRKADATDLASSAVVGKVTPNGAEQTVSLSEPVSSEYLLVWYSELPKNADGEFRGELAEISLS